MSPGLRAELAGLAGPGGLLTDPADCWSYGYDDSRGHALPQAVLFAKNPRQVSELVRLCARAGLPIVARGRGTGTVGSSVPDRGGLVLSFERMGRILRISPGDRLAVVEPGCVNETLQRILACHGFFWPPDPSSAATCTIGGNLAYNSAGPRAVKYGTPRENTLGLKAVLGTGETFRTGVMTTKGVVGYDLTRLIVGSEGTLALIVEATLKVSALPEAQRTLRAVYRDIHSAAAAVSAIMAQPVVPCALELMDAAAIAAVRGFAEIDCPEATGALLMIEVDGPEAGIDRAAKALEAAARNSGLLEVRLAADATEVAALWKTRKSLAPALRRIAPKRINEDVAVPVSRMGELIEGLTRLSEESGVRIVNFGHAGNGNIHVNLLVNPEDQDEIARALACLSEVFDLVLRLDGTLSGEHGVGLEKLDYVRRELDPVALRLMAEIKARFDPAGIFNPGKAIPSVRRDESP